MNRAQKFSYAVLQVLALAGAVAGVWLVISAVLLHSGARGLLGVLLVAVGVLVLVARPDQPTATTSEEIKP